MFQNAKPHSRDLIFKMQDEYLADSRPNKIDLTIGIYRNDEGELTTMSAVKKAQEKYAKQEKHKAYLPIKGDINFHDGLLKLLSLNKDNSAAIIQTPGASMALRLAADLICNLNSDANIWLSIPCYSNHPHVFKQAGLNIKYHPYYCQQSAKLDFNAMLNCLESQSKPNDILVLQPYCHNPTGANLRPEQHDTLINFINNKKIVPLLDIAYHGLGHTIEQDNNELKRFITNTEQCLITYSCSKNFGLYHDRLGALIAFTNNPEHTEKLQQNLSHLARGHYSNPPAHGGKIVTEILNDEALYQNWLNELNYMADRLKSIRAILAQRIKHPEVDFSFLNNQQGMFAMLPLNTSQLENLKVKHGIYIVPPGRINLSGLNDKNIDSFCNALNELFNA